MGNNPNTFQGIPETWSKEYQVSHLKVPVYPAIANYRLAPGLQVGDTVHRDYASSIVAKVMGADGSYSTQAVQDTDETLVVDKNYEASFYIKKLDELQNSLPVRTKYAKLSSAAIFNQIDGDVLGLYDQFTTSMDAGKVGGTTGEGITVTTSNVKKVFFTAKKLLQRQQIMLDNGAQFTGFKPEDDQNVMGVAVISPDVYQMLLEAVDGKDTVFGDKVAQSGHAGSYGGFQLFVSNALGWSGELLVGTQPTDGDTVTINGVTFTFKTTLGTTAGNVLIGADAAAAHANLVNAINNAEGTAASTVSALGKYVELSAANRLLLANVVATDTTGKLTIKATGYGFVTVAETLTAAADVWTTTKQVQHCLFGVANAIDVVVQQEPNMEINPVSGKVGKDIVTWAACGYKVFNDAKALMIDVRVRTDAY